MSYPIIGKERLEELVPAMATSMDKYSWLILSSDPSPTMLIYGVDKKGKVAHRYMGMGGHGFVKSRIMRGGKIRRAIARFLLRCVA